MDITEQTMTLPSAFADLGQANPISPAPEVLTAFCHHLFERHAAMHPASTAASFLDERLTYAELNERSNRLANYLIQNGAVPGSSVAVCVAPSFDVLICLLAVHKAGAAYVPLDPTYPAERLSVILADVAPCLVLTQSVLSPRLPPCPSPVFQLDRQVEALQSRPTVNPHVARSTYDPAVIFYTSGTTGTPKGVVLSYRNIAHYTQVAAERFEFCRSDAMPAMARFSFSISLFELLCPLVSGGRVIILEREHVLDFRHLVRTMQQATIMHASPHLWRKLLRYLQDQAIPSSSFRSLRHVSSGGDMVGADLIESLKRTFPSAEVFVIYGCSEIGCMGLHFPAPRDRIVSRNLVGKPFDGVSLKLLDEHQNPVAQGEQGEVYFSSNGVALGYLNRPQLTAERFLFLEGRRFYRTGDIGRLDADDNLELLGRADFQIQLRGMRIELGEIEAVLRQAPGIREAVVVARELDNQDKALVAYVVVEASSSLREILHCLRSKLPEYMVPSAFVILDALPVNLNQKLDRNALPTPTAQNCLRLSAAVAPRNPVEHQLAIIWQSILGLEAVGIQDDFLDVGGNSLLSITLAVEIERAFGVALPISTILTAPTIAQQALLIESGRTLRAPSVLLRPGESAPPLFLIHDGDGEVLPYRNLALLLKPEHAVYGIQPYGSWRFPMLHTRLTEIVSYYTAEIRRIQPTGPYFLGGLCIGGFIAFEIARELQQGGERVGMVALIDAAHVKAVPVSLAKRRLTRFFTPTAYANTERRAGAIVRWLSLAHQATQKIVNAAKYEIGTRIKSRITRSKLLLLRHCMDHGYGAPHFLEGLSVSTVLHFAEREYRTPTEPYAGKLLLLKATAKDDRLAGTPVDDTPYSEIFREPNLGWNHKAMQLEVHECPGGHSSMLQEPHVAVVARMVQSHIDLAAKGVASH
jgi:amino acid adenylation domain-containing protein